MLRIMLFTTDSGTVFSDFLRERDETCRSLRGEIGKIRVENLTLYSAEEVVFFWIAERVFARAGVRVSRCIVLVGSRSEDCDAWSLYAFPVSLCVSG